MLSIHITKSALRLLDFTGIILSSGQFLVTLYIKFTFKVGWTVEEEAAMGLCFGLSVILILLPSININERLFALDDKVGN